MQQEPATRTLTSVQSNLIVWFSQIVAKYVNTVSIWISIQKQLNI